MSSEALDSDTTAGMSPPARASVGDVPQGQALYPQQARKQKGQSEDWPFCLIPVARPERFERPTPWFVAKYSIQLSYGRLALFERAIIQSRPSSLKHYLVPYAGGAWCSPAVALSASLRVERPADDFEHVRR